MKPVDHGNCDPNECVHAREMMTGVKAETPVQDRETAYYEEKRRLKLDGPEAHGMAETMPPGMAEYDERRRRARRLEGLELEMMELREEMLAHGDPMPLQPLRNVVGDALRLAEHKNGQYGDAWRKNGYMGNLARIISKTDRLNNLLWRDPDGAGYPLPANYDRDGETVRDTLLDLINLSGFMLANWSEENRWGSGRA